MEDRDLLETSDAEIEEAVAQAEPLLLRGLIYQLTGDESIAGTVVEPTPGLWGMELPALTREEDIALIRERTAAFLRRHRDAGAPPLGIGPVERLPKSLGLALGAELPEEDQELWIEELAVDQWSRGLNWRRTPPEDRVRDFPVLVIGAGIGGLNAAVQLKRAGVPFTVVEKNSGVGGTWYENRYPGARVDNPSRAYTHVFGVGYDYPARFFTAEQNLRYFNWVADEFGVREDIVFDTEVTSLDWDEDSATWTVRAAGPDGPREWRARAVISAVGFLSRPKIPEIPGLEDFEGVSCHTARWPANLDIAGKRVAVIGTGSTGYQTIPEMALVAEHVYAFQRTPQWLGATPGYRAPHPPHVRWLDRNLPFHGNFTRYREMIVFETYVISRALDVDPDYEDEHARSALNKRVRDECIEFLERKLGDRPDLLARMIPQHPPFSARIVCTDEDYGIVDALLRDNVTLVTEGVQRATPGGIVAGDGTEHDVDVIVLATGFRASEYLWPMEVRGRGGQSVGELWAKDGPRAYRGMLLPGFPNFFIIYGPSTNGGLLPASQHEMVMRYAFRCIERLIGEDRRTVEVTEDAYWRHNEIVDARNALKMWSDPRANTSYYRGGPDGRPVTQNPFSGVEMWRMLREPDFDDLRIR